MSARPSTDPANQAEAQKPVMERPIGRRTMLRAAILTVPVVAAFSKSANAQTGTHPCPAGSTYCAVCNDCRGPVTSHCKCNNGSCNNAEAGCITKTFAGVRTATVSNTSGSAITSPFSGGGAINDGGFNSSPWQ